MTGKTRKSAVHTPESPQPAIDAFRSQQLALAQRHTVSV